MYKFIVGTCFWGLGAVGVVTGYGLEDLGAGVQVPVGLRIFTSPCRPGRHTRLPTQWLPGGGGLFPRGLSGQGVKLTAHLQPVPRSRKLGSIHPLSIRLHGVVLKYLSTGTILPFFTNLKVTTHLWGNDAESISSPPPTPKISVFTEVYPKVYCKYVLFVDQFPGKINTILWFNCCGTVIHEHCYMEQSSTSLIVRTCLPSSLFALWTKVSVRRQYLKLHSKWHVNTILNASSRS
jgi:hypothetical protein